jgi:hypothetical protein
MTTSPVRISGPLFRTDAGMKVKKAIDKVVIDVAKAGVKEVQAELRPGHGVETGEHKRNIRRKKKGLTSTVYGKDARKTAWLEGTSKRNRTTRFKGYGIMRAAARQTDQTAGEVARKIVAELVRDLN